jgi:glyoxalase family protein
VIWRLTKKRTTTMENLQLGGLHHVTAVTGNAPRNVAFYTQTLGLRLVKKTVNQDDVSAYHLFYGDVEGHPGTEITFFDWPDAGPRRPGAGTIAAILLRVPDRAAVEWWEQRLDQLGVAHEPIATHGDRAALPLRDFEGQRLEIVAPAPDEAEPVAGGVPWERSPIPAAFQIRGLHGVRLHSARTAASTRVLTEALGFQPVGSYTLPPETDAPAREVRVFQVGAGGPGTEVELEIRDDLGLGRVGIGGVHHVAFRTPNDAEHLAWRPRLLASGLAVTPQIDRYYFRSIYFREPGGVLFELATDGPGFATDEALEHLGERLALPPFLEPHRADIEAGLRPLETGEASGKSARQ